MSERDDVTRILRSLGLKGEQVMARIGPLLYRELHAIARRTMERGGEAQSMQPTMLVHEAYLRMAEQGELQLENRAHALRFAARAMRQILIDHARKRCALRRGGGMPRVELAGLADKAGLDPAELLALDEALDALAEHDERKAQVVELRFFACLSQAEIASSLRISERTVERESRYAKAWLRKHLDSASDPTGEYEA